MNKKMSNVGEMEGYDADFDPPLEKRLECPICLLAQRDPMQTPCGHRFCGPCLHRAIHVTGPKCPVDNQRIRVTQLFRDNFARREVLSLRVRCRMRENGCEWCGELRALDDHKKTCPFEEIKCPNGCGLTALRKVVNFHLDDCPKRWVPCEMCNLYVQYDGSEFHVSMCNKIILSPCQPAVTQKRHVVWSGELEWRDIGKQPIFGEETSPVTERLLVHASVKPNEQLMKTDNWPSCLHLHLVRSDLLCYIEDSYMETTKLALYMAGPYHHMVNGLFIHFMEKIGCVIFPETEGCSMEGFVMLWDRKFKSFIGIVPKEQRGFRAKLQSAVARNNQQMLAYSAIPEIPPHLPAEPPHLSQVSVSRPMSPPPWLQAPRGNVSPPSPPPRSYTRRSSPRSSRSGRSRRSQADPVGHPVQLPPSDPARHISFTCAFMPPLATMIQGTAVSPNMSQLQAISPPVTPMAPLLPFTLNSPYIYGRPPAGQGAASHPLPIRTYGRPIMSARQVLYHPYTRPVPDNDAHSAALAAGQNFTGFHSPSQSSSVEADGSPPRMAPPSLQPPSQPLNPMWDYFVRDMMGVGGEPVIATGQVIPPSAVPAPLPAIAPLSPMTRGSSGEVVRPQPLAVASATSGFATGHDQQQLRSGTASGMVPSGYTYFHYGPSFHPGR